MGEYSLQINRFGTYLCYSVIIQSLHRVDLASRCDIEIGSVTQLVVQGSISTQIRVRSCEAWNRNDNSNRILLITSTRPVNESPVFRIASTLILTFRNSWNRTGRACRITLIHHFWQHRYHLYPESVRAMNTLHSI